MSMKAMKNRGWWAVTAVAALWGGLGGVPAQSQDSVSQDAGLQIAECSVYSEAAPSRTYDCTAKAQERCGKGQSQQCELPIGLSLTDGRDIDGNKATWEKVRVRYKCGSAVRINGPHHQNEHASIILSCLGP